MKDQLFMKTEDGMDYESNGKYISVLNIVKCGIIRKFTSFIDRETTLCEFLDDMGIVYYRKNSFEKSVIVEYAGSVSSKRYMVPNGKVLQFICGTHCADVSTFNNKNEVIVVIAKNSFIITDYEIKPSLRSKIKKFSDYNKEDQDCKRRHNSRFIKFNKGKLNKFEFNLLIKKNVLVADPLINK